MTLPRDHTRTFEEAPMLRRSSTHRARPSRIGFVTVLLVMLSWATVVRAAPTLGFIENWSGTSLSGWAGGSTVSNPGTGGFSGPGDGYLVVSSAAATNLGTRSIGPEYTGNWSAAGVTQVRVWLNDV